MIDYFIELKDLYYDKVGLYNFQNEHENYVSNMHYKKIGNNTEETFKYLDLYNFDSEIAKQLCQRFNCKTDAKFTKILAHGTLPFHIDPNRTAVAMFPLTDNPSPISFVDKEDNLLYTHTYTCPTIINAKVRHGVPSTETDRIFFQVNCYLPWNEVVEMYQSGNLIKRKK